MLIIIQDVILARQKGSQGQMMAVTFPDQPWEGEAGKDCFGIRLKCPLLPKHTSTSVCLHLGEVKLSQCYGPGH